MNDINRCIYIYILYNYVVYTYDYVYMYVYTWVKYVITNVYIYISKCHMNQILSRAPAAFFFHSYAYARSISPAILRFALGCHDVTRT